MGGVSLETPRSWYMDSTVPKRKRDCSQPELQLPIIPLWLKNSFSSLKIDRNIWKVTLKGWITKLSIANQEVRERDLLLLLTLIHGFWLFTPIFELFTLSFRLAKKLTIGTQDVRRRNWPAVSTCCSLFKVIHRLFWICLIFIFLISGGYSTFLVVFLFLILNKFSFFLFVSTRYRRFLWMQINLIFPILPVLVLV